MIELLLTSVDVIDGLVANAKDGSPVPENMEQVLAELKRANGQPATESTAKNVGGCSAAAEAAQGYRISIQTVEEFFRFGQDPLLLLRELFELAKVTKIEVDDKSLPSLADIEPEQCYLSWTLELQTDKPEQSLHDVFMFLDAGSKYTIEPIPAQTKVATGAASKTSTTNPSAEPSNRIAQSSR